MTSQPRPARCIWLTEDDVEYLGGQRSAEARAYLKSKWDAAPADAAEAVAEWFFANFHGADEDPDSVRNGADEICRALGYPHTEQA